VEWLKNGNGIFFQNLGIVYGPAEFNDLEKPPLFKKNESITVELWLTPSRDDDGGFSCIFRLYDENRPEIFSLSQVRSFLNLSKYQNPKNNKSAPHDWRWVKNAFPKGQRRFLTITSDKNHTKVYLDGKKVKYLRNYSLTPKEELTPAWRIIIGNDPTGRGPWTGKIHGLAIYNHSLSSKKVFEHFEKWRDDSAISLLKEKGVIALYPMDEQKGNLIHNALNNRYNLLIPDRFKILKKNFLEFSSSALKKKDTSRRDMIINIIGFIPLGYFLLLVFNLHGQYLKMSAWRLIFPAILGGMIVSLIIETLQGYLPTRISSLSDLIFNTFGTGLGIILAMIFITLKTRPQRTSFSE
jgi:VanZ family protein